MTLYDAQTLPDVQATSDARDVALDEVGVSGLALPVEVLGRDGAVQATVADFDLTVSLVPESRGTHMSRFVEEAAAVGPLTVGTITEFAERLRDRLVAPSSQVAVRCPLFLRRSAPESGLIAHQRYDVWFRATAGPTTKTLVGVRVAVTSLCPCSREISDYGAHSQRGYIELEVECPEWRSGEGIWPEELYAYADAAGSAPIHPLLKRVDERAVTMQAYNNPAFVEDIARDVVTAVRDDPRCTAWSVAVTNYESIHDHQAVARVHGRR